MTDLDDLPFNPVVIRRTSAGWRVESECPEEADRLLAGYGRWHAPWVAS
jgi:hypothetical protein